VFTNGVADAGGCPDLRRRARLVANDLLDALAALAAERSVRVAVQEARDRAVDLLGKHASDALTGQVPESSSPTYTRHSEWGMGG
jgi:hypothetical protein